MNKEVRLSIELRDIIHEAVMEFTKKTNFDFQTQTSINTYAVTQYLAFIIGSICALSETDPTKLLDIIGDQLEKQSKQIFKEIGKENEKAFTAYENGFVKPPSEPTWM